MTHRFGAATPENVNLLKRNVVKRKGLPTFQRSRGRGSLGEPAWCCPLSAPAGAAPPRAWGGAPSLGTRRAAGGPGPGGRGGGERSGGGSGAAGGAPTAPRDSSAPHSCAQLTNDTMRNKRWARRPAPWGRASAPIRAQRGSNRARATGQLA